jgi:hypothetical protein
VLLRVLWLCLVSHLLFAWLEVVDRVWMFQNHILISGAVLIYKIDYYDDCYARSALVNTITAVLMLTIVNCVTLVCSIISILQHTRRRVRQGEHYQYWFHCTSLIRNWFLAKWCKTSLPLQTLVDRDVITLNDSHCETNVLCVYITICYILWPLISVVLHICVGVSFCKSVITLSHFTDLWA